MHTSKAQLFGEMLDIADGVVEAYRSDLYWDAKTIEEWDGQIPLVWSLRRTGTYLVIDIPENISHIQYCFDNWGDDTFLIHVVENRYSSDTAYEVKKITKQEWSELQS